MVCVLYAMRMLYRNTPYCQLSIIFTERKKCTWAPESTRTSTVAYYCMLYTHTHTLYKSITTISSGPVRNCNDVDRRVNRMKTGCDSISTCSTVWAFSPARRLLLSRERKWIAIFLSSRVSHTHSRTWRAAQMKLVRIPMYGQVHMSNAHTSTHTLFAGERRRCVRTSDIGITLRQWIIYYSIRNGFPF